MGRRMKALFAAAVAVMGAASLAHALPVTLKDSNGTKYNVNTQVVPLGTLSDASGALTNATYTQPVTVTSYYVAFTPFFFFLTTYTVQRQVNVPLTPAFEGFNGLLVTAVNGTKLAVPLVFNPGQPATPTCPDSNNKNQELEFASQAFPAQNITLTRRVFVPSNKTFLRWENVVTNNGPAQTQVTITLLGLLASGDETKVIATSTGDTALGSTDLWFTTGQSVPTGTSSLQPKIGYVVQGPGASTPAAFVGISTTTTPPGKSALSYTVNLPPNGSATIMTFTTVQGQAKQAKSTCQNLTSNPLPSAAIKCMTEAELAQVVNFEKITPPDLKSSTVKLKFNKTNQDTVVWKGKITVAGGISLKGLPVTVDFGGVTQSFVLKKSGAANNGGGNKFNLSAELKNGVTKPGTYNFSFNLKGDLQTALAGYGLTNASASNVAVSIPVTLTAGPGEYAVDQPYTYKATQGKSGTATAPPS